MGLQIAQIVISRFAWRTLYFKKLWTSKTTSGVSRSSAGCPEVGKVKRRDRPFWKIFDSPRAHTARPIKIAVPGPSTVVDSTLDEAYGDEEALAIDVASALNLELLDLQAAGCDVVQIDEPAMTRYHKKVTAYGARALDRCLEGIHIPTIVHLCYGYPGGGQHEYEYPELLEELMKTRVGGFAVEFARSNHNPSVLKICQGR